MTKDYDSEIKSAEAELAASISQLDKVMTDFISATAEYVRPFYWREAEKFVQSKAELTEQLGDEKLAALKAKVKELHDNTDNVIANALSDEALWWHKIHGDQMYSFNGFVGPSILDAPIRRAIGKLATIFEKYGYISLGSDHGSSWRDNLGMASYRYELPWSDEMKRLLDQYGGLSARARPQAELVKKLTEAKKANGAKNRWDSL